MIRQLSGCNDHPTSTQFLTAVNSLSFCILVKAPDTGNCAGDTLTSLVGTDEVAIHVDNLLDTGNLDEDSSVLQASTLLSDHVYPVQVSDGRLVYYLAGYVARRKLMATKCQDCFEQVLKSLENADKDLASFTAFCDVGGLLYLSPELFSFVEALEDTFTSWFSYNKLQRDTIVELLNSMQTVPSV